MGEINEDLQRERGKCTFKVQELTHLIDGGAERTKLRKHRESILLSEKEFFEGTPEEYLSHKEKYENSIRKSVIMFNLVKKLQIEGSLVSSNLRDLLDGLLGTSSFKDGTPLALHYMLFVPNIVLHGTIEQQAHWMPRAWNCSILGTYAQTELGHGTFIRGLETTATFDSHTQEFVLHSPTLTSYKWWPGGLGNTVNYSIVAAQLYTNGQCHGIHFFIVQLRDEETHMPLPGIKIGDVGAKLGLNAVNNGFLGFDHVRIPRDQMFMKHVQVLEDGTYVKSKSSKLNYGSMVFMRVVIVFDMVNYLSKAVTIATRYSAVRRQCQIKEDQPECQILDYLTQQHKIFSGIATCHALKLTGSKLWDTFHEVNSQLDGGNLERLPELHALVCCLKAVSTSDTAALVERCRLACGGHGFMQSSNLPFTYGQVTAACTYEGENTVLLLQTARFLIKTWQNKDTSKLTPTVAYFETALNNLSLWQNSVEGIIRGFEVVAMRKISSSANSIKRRVESGLSFEDAWNMTSVQLVAAAEAHCRVVILRTYNEETSRLTVNSSEELRAVMHQLVELYTVYWALERVNDLLRYTSISKEDIDQLQHWYEELLCKIRPNAVGLVDAFDIHDMILGSTLGAYDGRVYERLMEEALKNPLNAEPVNESFHKYLKPFMRGQL